VSSPQQRGARVARLLGTKGRRTVAPWLAVACVSPATGDIVLGDIVLGDIVLGASRLPAVATPILTLSGCGRAAPERAGCFHHVLQPQPQFEMVSGSYD
jgi:hypothetical protein